PTRRPAPGLWGWPPAPRRRGEPRPDPTRPGPGAWPWWRWTRSAPTTGAGRGWRRGPCSSPSHQIGEDALQVLVQGDDLEEAGVAVPGHPRHPPAEGGGVARLHLDPAVLDVGPVGHLAAQQARGQGRGPVGAHPQVPGAVVHEVADGGEGTLGDQAPLGDDQDAGSEALDLVEDVAR